MLLLDTKKPISLDEIARRIGGFPESPGARHQAFERAKKELRELGIPIATHQIPGEEQYGYQIERSEMILPDLRFTDDEASAIAAASALVSFGGGARESALQKLGCVVSGGEATVASIPDQPALFRLFEAMGARKVVTFSYRAKLRNIDIYGISFRWGNWYVIGNERETGKIKTFLVNRVDSEVLITSIDALEKPGDFNISSRLPKNRWEVGEGKPVAVEVVAHPDVAPLLGYELLGEAGYVRSETSGDCRFSFEVIDTGSFFDWLLGYFDKVKLLGPASMVAGFVEYLRRLLAEPTLADQELLLAASVGSQAGSGSSQEACSATPFETSREGRPSQTVSAGDLRSATAMYSALVKILPWLARKKTTTVGEISQTFSVSIPEVVRLLEIAACCGLPPYTPDSLLEIIVEDDGTVVSFLDMDIITAPRKLTTLEATVLATIAAAALKVPGIDDDAHLASALQKLQVSLSKFEIALSEVDVGIEEPYFLGSLRSAVNERKTVELTYFSSSSERVSKREVDPYQLFTESGRWYMRGFCHLAGEVRHFHLGRIISCEATGSTFQLPLSEMKRIRSGDIPRAFGGDGEQVLIGVPEGSGWLVERLTESPQFLVSAAGYDLYKLRSSSVAWISKLLVRLPPYSCVVAPTQLRSLKGAAIQTLLDMYH